MPKEGGRLAAETTGTLETFLFESSTFQLNQRTTKTKDRPSLSSPLPPQTTVKRKTKKEKTTVCLLLLGRYPRALGPRSDDPPAISHETTEPPNPPKTPQPQADRNPAFSDGTTHDHDNHCHHTRPSGLSERHIDIRTRELYGKTTAAVLNIIHPSDYITNCFLTRKTTKLSWSMSDSEGTLLSLSPTQSPGHPCPVTPTPAFRVP